MIHLKIALGTLYHHTKFQLNWSNTCNFMANFMFFPYQEAVFWDESKASQESDGPIVSWTKMISINSSIRFHDAQNNLNDILFTHVKFYRQWLLTFPISDAYQKSNLIYYIELFIKILYSQIFIVWQSNWNILKSKIKKKLLQTHYNDLFLHLSY